MQENLRNDDFYCKKNSGNHCTKNRLHCVAIGPNIEHFNHLSNSRGKMYNSKEHLVIFTIVNYLIFMLRFFLKGGDNIPGSVSLRV